MSKILSKVLKIRKKEFEVVEIMLSGIEVTGFGTNDKVKVQIV